METAEEFYIRKINPDAEKFKSDSIHQTIIKLLEEYKSQFSARGMTGSEIEQWPEGDMDNMMNTGHGWLETLLRFQNYLLSLSGVKTEPVADKTATRNEWISVRDRLPKKGIEVICVGYKGEMLIGSVYGRDLICCESENDMLTDITHWQPLPEPPSSQRGEQEEKKPVYEWVNVDFALPDTERLVFFATKNGMSIGYYGRGGWHFSENTSINNYAVLYWGTIPLPEQP
jgi:hypothetical protein